MRLKANWTLTNGEPVWCECCMPRESIPCERQINYIWCSSVKQCEIESISGYYNDLIMSVPQGNTPKNSLIFAESNKKQIEAYKEAKSRYIKYLHEMPLEYFKAKTNNIKLTFSSPIIEEK